MNDASDKAAPRGKVKQAGGMRQAAAHGAVWLGLTQVLRIGLTFLSTVIIARLLTPDDFGVIAMTAPVMTLMTILQEAGLTTATIQAKEINRDQSNALFWTNLLIGTCGAMLLLALSPLVGWFYGDWRAAEIAAAGGLGLVVTAMGMQHAALLARNMRFATIAKVEIAAMTANYGVAFTLAIVLQNYWALFFGALTGQVVQSILLWCVAGFRPGLPSLAAARKFLGFGANFTGFTLMTFLVRNADTVFVARFHGSLAAGLYDRSYKLMLMPLQNINGPVNRLLQPMMARLRDEPERYRRAFNLGLRGVMLASAPAVAVAALLSDRLMIWLLGPRWEAAGAIFFWLGLNGLLQPISNLTGLLFVTTDRTRSMFRWGILSAATTLPILAFAVRYGAAGVAAGLFVSSLLRSPVLYMWSASKTHVKGRDLFSAQIEPVIGALAVAMGARFFGQGLPFLPLFALAVALAYPAAFLTSQLTRDGRRWTRELGGMGLEYASRAAGAIPFLRNMRKT